MALTILNSLDLDDSATNEQTGTVGEPSVATTGQRMFVTGNWFASRSTDSGTSWSLIDPFTELPSAAGGFCCDQIPSYQTGVATSPGPIHPGLSGGEPSPPPSSRIPTLLSSS